MNQIYIFVCNVGSIYRGESNPSQSELRSYRGAGFTRHVIIAHRSHNQSDPPSLLIGSMCAKLRGKFCNRGVTFSLVFAASYKNTELSAEIDTIPRTNSLRLRLHWFASAWLASPRLGSPHLGTVHLGTLVFYTGSVTVRRWAESTQ